MLRKESKANLETRDHEELLAVMRSKKTKVIYGVYPEVFSIDLLRHHCLKKFTFMLKHNFSNLDFDRKFFHDDMHE